MSTPVQKEIPIPAKKWRGEAAPRSYAQMLPEKEILPEIRPGPLKTQHGPSAPPPKTFDPSAPPPKIEVAPEELFENPEIQRLYRRIILGKE